MFNTYNMHTQDDGGDDQKLPHIFEHLLYLIHIQAQEIEAQEIETLEQWFALPHETN